MSVVCEGDSRIMEQLGEKQDFETALTARGYAHELFDLNVRTAGPSTYTLVMTYLPTRRRTIYWGGPGKNWVRQFTSDLSLGVYGAPGQDVDLNHRRSNRPRLRLISSRPSVQRRPVS